ncbi:MAG: hypothetical protein RJA07_1168 [Bacteroidota bacterium]|jgi:PKD repeat protein
MKKTILILFTAVFALGITGCKKTPIANFAYSPSSIIYVGEPVTFTDYSTNEPTNWAWNFGADFVAPSASKIATATYNSAGTYNVKLTVFNSSGSSSITKQIQVINHPPPAYLGSFHATETDITNGVNNSNYTTNITASLTKTNGIVFDYFNNHSAFVNATVSGNSISIDPSQDVFGAPVSGSGTISGTTITMNYSVYDFGTSTYTDYSTVFVKQ